MTSGRSNESTAGAAAIEYEVYFDGSQVVLPSVGAGDRCWDYSSWDTGDGERLRRFAKLAASTKRLSYERPTVVQVELVPRPDNSYNSNAVAVAMPSEFGGSPDNRHLGYLPDHRLARIGVDRIPELAQLFGAAIRCTGQLYRGPLLLLDLPSPQLLGVAIKTLIDAARPTRRIHEEPCPDTDQALLELSKFPFPESRIRGIDIRSFTNPELGRYHSLWDADTGDQLGEVSEQILELLDERGREQVLGRLADTPIEVKPPSDVTHLLAEVSWDGLAVPNLHTYWFSNGVQLRTFDQELRERTIATYNAATHKLWVEDSRLVGPSLIYASRLGLAVHEYAVPRVPWQLSEEVDYRDLHGRATTDSDCVAEPDWETVPLLDQARALIPSELLPHIALRTSNPSGADQEPEDQFLYFAARYPGRAKLFGQHSLTRATQQCRLCGYPAATFTTPLSTDKLAYCDSCLGRAAGGWVRDRVAAAAALRILGELEFENQAMLEQELDRLQAQAQPLPGPEVDRLLLLRYFVRRNAFPWTELLAEANLLDTGLRTGRGTVVRARDGHLCTSLGEKAVCDYLWRLGITHTKEPLYPFDEELNPRGRRRADWRLDDGTFIELWGMPDQPDYAEKMREKRELARRHNIRLLELSYADLGNLQAVL